MFKYTGSHTSSSMSHMLKMDGVEREQQQHQANKLKKRRFFGSPPAAVSSRGEFWADGGTREAMPATLPRSRSCQCTARIKRPTTAGAVAPETMDRRWWLEPADIPSIDGDQPNGRGGPKGKPKGARASAAASAREQLIGGGRGKAKGRGTLAAEADSSGLLHALLVPMLTSSSTGSSTTCCCSDSPCSSSSLAIPGLLLPLDPSPPGLCPSQNGHGPENGHAKGMAQTQWPSAEELGRCLSRLFPSVESSSSPREVLALLLCLRPFITPAELLHKLLQHTMFVQHASAANFSKDSQRRLFDHVLAFFALWVHSIPYDFRTQPMRDRLLAVLSLSGAQKDPAAQALCDELLAELRMALGRVERYEQAIRSLEPQLERQWEKRWDCPGGLSALGKPALVVAQQLAHIELERLSMLGLDELVETLGHANSLDQLGQRHPLSGCVHHYVHWFNQLSQLTASELLRHQHKRHRAKCADFLLEVARECLALGNFNSLAAIMAGLSCQPVARLKKTWARVDKSRLEVLQRQLDPSGNFSTYRATLKAAIWAQAEHRRPCAPPALLVVPFFGLLLKDLFLLFCQCRVPGPGGHLNRMAFDEFGEHMAQLEAWKGAECGFPRDGPVLQHFLLSPLLAERSMFLLSYGYELPENSADREHLRWLNQQQQEKEKMMASAAGNGVKA